MTTEQLKPAKETDEAYYARMKDAAHQVMDFFCADENENPDYVDGFVNGYMQAIHTIPTTHDIFTFGGEGANRFYDDGFRDALAHLGCNWIGDPQH